MEGKDKAAETRERLLEAAGEVFAERGFKDATIREIAEKARANVAAAHYHFGDKEELYSAVLRSCAPPRLDLAPATGSAEAQLRAFAKAVLARFFEKGRPAWLGRLVAQEMIEPTRALEQLIEAQIRPNAERLKAIVRKLVGRKMDEQELWRCTFSVAAQWVFYFHNRQVVQRLNPGQQFAAQDIDRLADHIAKFSVAALKAWKK